MGELELLHVNLGTARRIAAGERRILSAIGKQAVYGAVRVTPMGLEGDEQADLSVHGGLNKAIYAYPTEHYPFWREQRQRHGVSLFDEDLPSGFMGENLSISGLLESVVFIGDALHFPDCILRVTDPREPCFKFNAIMGFNQAGKVMAQSGHCGFYLSVQQPGFLQAGQKFQLVAGSRSLSIRHAFAARMGKHLRE